jgi:hypothetical protein
VNTNQHYKRLFDYLIPELHHKVARMRLFGRRSKKGAWSSQVADETTKAEDSGGPRVLKKSTHLTSLNNLSSPVVHDANHFQNQGQSLLLFVMSP